VISDQQRRLNSGNCATVAQPLSTVNSSNPQFSEIAYWTPSDRDADQMVSEVDVNLQSAQEMARLEPNSSCSPQFQNPPQGLEVFEYHDRLNSITILSRALGNADLHKRVRFVLRDAENASTRQQGLFGLDPIDIDYLRKRGALTLPAKTAW
jgi:hypothetical protein